MFSRLPRLLPALAAAAAGLLLLATGSPAQPPAPAPAGQPSPADLKAKQEENAKLFKDFTDSLVRLANRLEKSDRLEDKEKAKTITRAIELASKENVSGQFSKLVQGLAKGKTDFDLSNLQGDEAQLRAMLKQILDILVTDDESAARKEEIRRLEAILKQVKELERTQKVTQAITEGKSGDPKKIEKTQNDITDKTKDIVQQTGDKKDPAKPGAGGDKKDDRAEAKPEAKPGEAAGEGKPETGEAKGEGKEGMGEPKPGEGKEGEGKGMGEGMGKEGMGEGEPGEGKDGMGEPKPGEGKGAGEPKPMTGGTPMPMDPKNPMGGAGKPSDGKPGEGKGEGQGKGEGKPGDAKAGEGKGAGKPGEGKPGEGQPGAGKPGEGKPGQPGQPGAGQPQKPPTPGRKELEEAIPLEQQAAKKVGEDNRKEAGKKQDEVLDKIAQAIQELEKRLKQLREEETKKLLAALENRINKMLVMQIEVYEATKGIDGNIKKNMGEIGPADRQKSLQQGDREGEIVVEADKAMKLMENEGSAVAFATVLNEVRQDMIAVQRRLSQVYVDKQTQVIEEQIIAMLKDMAEALKKAQQEPKPPEPGKPGEPQKPANKKLLDLIAELKLIRSLQKTVNERTKGYGDLEKAEQSKDPIIQAELKMLAAKQAKLQEMLDKIGSKGDE